MKDFYHALYVLHERKGGLYQANLKQFMCKCDKTQYVKPHIIFEGIESNTDEVPQLKFVMTLLFQM
jgi:hypothetical protein